MILLKCKACGNNEELIFNPDMPKGTAKIECNYCPVCDDLQSDYWEEQFYDKDGNELFRNEN